MNWAIIMAGGYGERFWPRSRRKQPKQLLPIVGDKTMIQQTVERVRPLVGDAAHVGERTSHQDHAVFGEMVVDLDARAPIAVLADAARLQPAAEESRGDVLLRRRHAFARAVEAAHGAKVDARAQPPTPTGAVGARARPVTRCPPRRLDRPA